MVLEMSNLFTERKFEDDGAVVLQKQFAKGGTTPVLTTVGSVVFWEKGLGAYDVYNSSLDTNLWTKTETLGTVTEGASTILVHINVGGGAGASGESVETKNLPALSLMTELEFRINLNLQSGLITIGGRYTFFGNVYDKTTTPQLPDWSDGDSIWKLTKKENGDWEVYDDDVLFDTITPSDNKIKVEITGDNGGNPFHIDLDLYEITVDGGVYMLVRSSDATLQLPLDPLQ